MEMGFYVPFTLVQTGVANSTPKYKKFYYTLWNLYHHTLYKIKSFSIRMIFPLRIKMNLIYRTGSFMCRYYSPNYYLLDAVGPS